MTKASSNLNSNPNSIPSEKPSSKELWKYFLHLGLTSYGGPLAIVAQMQRDFAAKKWSTVDEFNTTIPLIKSMPGPVALQTAAFWGGQMLGLKGALISSIGLTLPAMIMMMAFAAIYPTLQSHSQILHSFKGLQIVALVLVVKSLFDLGRPIYKEKHFQFFSILALAMTYIQLPEPLIFLVTGIIAYLTWSLKNKKGPKNLLVAAFPNTIFISGSLLSSPASISIALSESAAITSLGFAFWFSFGTVLITAGTLVFGTGLAILPFLQSQFVEQLHWMKATEFLDALAFAQLTPGPVLIIVTFLGYRFAGLLGALFATILVFLPGFFHMTTWFPIVFKKLRSQKWITPVSQAIMGAVIASLAVSSYKLTQSFNRQELSLGFILLFIVLKKKIPSYYIFLIGAVTGWLFLS